MKFKYLEFRYTPQDPKYSGDSVSVFGLLSIVTLCDKVAHSKGVLLKHFIAIFYFVKLKITVE